MSKYTKVSLNIIVMFIVAIGMAIIPQNYHELFGDWFCEGHAREGVGCLYLGYYQTFHNPEWHWGYIHYLFFGMGLSLFTVQVVKIIEIINKK